MNLNQNLTAKALHMSLRFLMPVPPSEQGTHQGFQADQRIFLTSPARLDPQKNLEIILSISFRIAIGGLKTCNRYRGIENRILLIIPSLPPCEIWLTIHPENLPLIFSIRGVNTSILFLPIVIGACPGVEIQLGASIYLCYHISQQKYCFLHSSPFVQRFFHSA